MNKWVAVVCVAWLVFLGWLSFMDFKKSDETKYAKEIIWYQTELNNKSDTLLIIINSQAEIQRYLLRLKKDVDSLKAVKR